MFEERMEEAVLARLKGEREKQKLSQLDLSNLSGVSQNMITYIETGKRTPSLRTFLKLCQALKINPAVLFKDEDDEKERLKAEIIELVSRI